MRKENRTYYFSVEGDTEQWYLEWLQKTINATPSATCTVKFENLEQYKSEANFKRILSRLTLDHVQQAIRRSKAIMQRNRELGYRLQQYKGHQYYKENPSLLLWEQIERILQVCGIV